MPRITLTLPLLPGKEEAWRRFCQELQGARHAAYEASRQQMGVTHEQVALIQTALGAAASISVEAPDLGRALAALVTSPAPFDRWFRQRLAELHGLRLDPSGVRVERALPVPGTTLALLPSSALSTISPCPERSPIMMTETFNQITGRMIHDGEFRDRFFSQTSSLLDEYELTPKERYVLSDMADCPMTRAAIATAAMRYRQISSGAPSA